MTQIIGHRGAAGLATENTIASFVAAQAAGVDVLEFDLRRTKDQQIVVNHDKSLLRVFGIDMNISEHSLKELQQACPELATFSEIIKACGRTNMVIELKEPISSAELKKLLADTPTQQYAFASFKPEAIDRLDGEFPDTPRSLLSFLFPCWRAHQAKRMKLQGIGVYYLFLNPFIYWLASRYKLNLYVYTVNVRWVAVLISKLYPRVSICTNRPDLFQSLRTK